MTSKKQLVLLDQMIFSGGSFMMTISQILCMNEDAAQVLRLRKEQYTICPSVATDDIIVERNETENFTVISAGRFVPLKGFDITLRAFAAFYHSLSMEQRRKSD
ncbi:MAG: glycosyltransferase involved in cell wall biosynthesis [Bacteroidia bacterium]|jgi:glycosyltransferase involved in cell wall biosynthesis